MKISQLIALSLVMTLVLTGCQLFSSGSGVAPATEVPAAAATPYPDGSQVALPVISSGAYPGSEAQLTPMAGGAYPESGGSKPALAAEAYPAPAAQSLVAQLEPVLPELKDGAEVAWSQVKEIVFSGQVVKIGQTYDLNVTLTLKDGRKFKTVEPGIDDILKLVQACGTLCQDIKVATKRSRIKKDLAGFGNSKAVAYNFYGLGDPSGFRLPSSPSSGAMRRMARITLSTCSQSGRPKSAVDFSISSRLAPAAKARSFHFFLTEV
jgi:hypothetical protein